MFTGATKGGREAVKVGGIPWSDEENNIKISPVFKFRKYNRPRSAQKRNSMLTYLR